jgi:hypothetical protein
LESSRHDVARFSVLLDCAVDVANSLASLVYSLTKSFSSGVSRCKNRIESVDGATQTDGEPSSNVR